MTSLNDIYRRRAQLVARAAVQRGEVATTFQRLDTPLRVAEGVVSFVRFIKSHPLVPIVAAVGVAVAFAVSGRVSIPRIFKRVLIGAIAVWRTYRSLRGWIAYGQTALLSINAMRRSSEKKNIKNNQNLQSGAR